MAICKILTVSIQVRGQHRTEIGLLALSLPGLRARPESGSTDNIRVRDDLWPV